MLGLIVEALLVLVRRVLHLVGELLLLRVQRLLGLIGILLRLGLHLVGVLLCLVGEALLILIRLVRHLVAVLLHVCRLLDRGRRRGVARLGPAPGIVGRSSRLRNALPAGGRSGHGCRACRAWDGYGRRCRGVAPVGRRLSDHAGGRWGDRAAVDRRGRLRRGLAAREAKQGYGCERGCGEAEIGSMIAESGPAAARVGIMPGPRQLGAAVGNMQHGSYSAGWRLENRPSGWTRRIGMHNLGLERR